MIFTIEFFRIRKSDNAHALLDRITHMAPDLESAKVIGHKFESLIALANEVIKQKRIRHPPDTRLSCQERFLRGGPMSSKKQPRTLHGNKTEQKSGLSRHYGEIGIKAVAAATRKESTASPRSPDSMAINRNRNSTEGGHNE
jgi:hypothetical protein